MSFSDRPIIDSPSSDSERSELAVRNYLNQQTGFICRNDFPDKGCDLDVELIASGRFASNRRVGVQLKSVNRLPILADGETISYAFETSRLGYLLNRPIGEGLIVLYDVSNSCLYYEYALTIYNSLMKERGSEDWQELNSVNIHINKCNKLNAQSAVIIHDYFSKRFETAAFLMASQGPKYGFEMINKSVEGSYDIHNPDSVRQLLLEHGMSLLQDNKLDLCFSLLRSLPQAEVDKHGELLLLGAITYGEAGRRYESENLIRKLYRQKKIPPFQEAMIAYCHLKNKLALDQISIEDFVDEAKKIRDGESGEYNKVIIELNIIFYELVMRKFYYGVPADIPERIRSLSAQILSLSIAPQRRRFLQVINAENLAQYINIFRLHYFHDLTLLRQSRQPTRVKQLKADRNLLDQLNMELNDNLNKLYDSAKEEDDNLLKAQALLVQARYLFAIEMDLFLQNWVDFGFHDEAKYIEHIKLCLHGYDLFADLGYVEQAYQCLCYGLELILIGQSRYGYSYTFNLQSLNDLKERLEQDQDSEPYEMQFPLLEERMAAINTEADAGYMIETKDLDDKQLEGLASSISKAFLLPEECFNNLVKELHECRIFYQRRSSHIELLPYGRNHDKRVVYRFPVRFVIKDNRTGIQSVPSTSVIRLLDDSGL